MAILGRAFPIRPHLARPITAATTANPVIAGSTVKAKIAIRLYERRGAPHPHLPGPVVAPGGPVVPGITQVKITVVKRPKQDWNAPRPHLAKPLLFVPGLPLPGAVIKSIAVPRSHERRFTTRVHLPPPVPPPGGQPVQVLGRSGLFSREAAGVQWRLLRTHVPASIVSFAVPVIAGQTVKLTGIGRMQIGRRVPGPHLAPGIVAPGGPFIAARTSVLVPVDKRSLQLYRVPEPHLPPRTLTQPAPTMPFAPTVFIGQAKPRALVGRTIPKPHLAPRTLTPSPFPPALVIVQSKQRPPIGRRAPTPHVPGPVVFQPPPPMPPLAPPVIINAQALKRVHIGRTTPRPHIARPLVNPRQLPQDVIWAAEIGDYRWLASVATSERWGATLWVLRWDATTGQMRWEAVI